MLVPFPKELVWMVLCVSANLPVPALIGIEADDVRRGAWHTGMLLEAVRYSTPAARQFGAPRLRVTGASRAWWRAAQSSGDRAGPTTGSEPSAHPRSRPP